jgi:transposase-like protein
MSIPTPNGSRSWAYPECPQCDSDVFVRGTPGCNAAELVCELCDRRFLAGEGSDAQ